MYFETTRDERIQIVYFAVFRDRFACVSSAKKNIKYSIHVFWLERGETVQTVCSALAGMFCGCLRVG